ncbi:MAG: AarF/UbiB family protein [Pseudonocardia sp.]|nr:AarF/UbiB family protein [Pseudonocardia sp.]
MTTLDIPRSSAARTARIAALPIAFSGRAIAGWGARLAGADRETVSAAAVERNAEQLFAVLGQLKGGAMKVGQALSVYEPMMPAEIAGPYRRALITLQSQSPAMPVRDVHRVLDEQLGRAWRDRVVELDETPAAAASVGQVHRAQWRARGGSLRTVAIKVQYPGADAALDTDLRMLGRFARLFTLLVPGLDARAITDELRARVLEELDYRAEADHQRRFAAEFGGGPDLHVPAVVASAPRVLVSEWLDGTPLSAFLDGAHPDRDRWGHTIVETMFATPARIGLLHADPHPGNALVLTDGRLALVDYGAVAVLPGGFPQVLATILRHLAAGEAAQLMSLLRAEGFVAGEVAVQDVLRFVGALADPLRTEEFRFDRAWMGRQGKRMVNLRSRAYWETGRALALPAEHLLVARVLSGWLNVLAQLDCTVGVRGLARQWLPGFAWA